MKIPHTRPWIDDQDITAVVKVLRSGQLAQGPQVAAFEKAMQRFQQSKDAVAVSSGTAALHLSLLALDVGPDDEVIIPSFVCTALLNAVHYTGASPRIVDVNDEDFNISFSCVAKNLTPRTKAIIVPHMFGQAADMKPLLRLGLPIIEDCAQALGARYHNQKVGTFGLLSVFSFYATKIISCGEGGMITSSNQRLLKRIRDLRDYDQRKNYKIRYNYKMTDMAAALGLCQLKKLPKIIIRRQKIASEYHARLAGSDLELPLQNQGKSHIYFRYVIKTRHKAKIIQKLHQKGISCAAPIVRPLHRYMASSRCPVTDQLIKRAVSIPIYPELTSGQIKKIARCFQQNPKQE